MVLPGTKQLKTALDSMKKNIGKAQIDTKLLTTIMTALTQSKQMLDDAEAEDISACGVTPKVREQCVSLEVAVRQITTTSDSTKSSRHIVDQLPKVKEAMDLMLECIVTINNKSERLFIDVVRREGQWSANAELSFVQTTTAELSKMNEASTRLNEIINRMDSFVLGEMGNGSVSTGPREKELKILQSSCTYREQAPCNHIGGKWGRGAGIKLERKRINMRSQKC